MFTKRRFLGLLLVIVQGMMVVIVFVSPFCFFFCFTTAQFVC